MMKLVEMKRSQQILRTVPKYGKSGNQDNVKDLMIFLACSQIPVLGNPTKFNCIIRTGGDATMQVKQRVYMFCIWE